MSSSIDRQTPALSMIEDGYPITAENNLECILCNFQAMGRTRHSLFLEHMKESHARGPISWVCKICNNFRSAAPGSVGAHTRQCKILNVSAYREILRKIEEGNKTFPVLNEAAITYAGGTSPAVCPSCDEKILGRGQYNSLENHLRVCHLAKSITYICALCNTHSTASIYSARAHYSQCFKRVKVKDADTGVTTSEAQERKDGLFCDRTTYCVSEHAERPDIYAPEEDAVVSRSASLPSTEKTHLFGDGTHLSDGRDPSTHARDAAEQGVESRELSCPPVGFVPSAGHLREFVEVLQGPTSTSPRESRNISSRLFDSVASAAHIWLENSDELSTPWVRRPDSLASSFSTGGTLIEHGERNESQFSIEEAYEGVVKSLKKNGLHPRYRFYLETERNVLRHSEGPIDKGFVEMAATRYEDYLRCGRSKVSPEVSKARQAGLRIIKLRRVATQSLCAIAYHVYRNPARWKKVSEKLVSEINSNIGYYRLIANNVA
ncbi:hypothetical protein ACOME3_010488 [Neoechinorhynchus agilis]